MDPITIGAILGAGTGLLQSRQKQAARKNQAQANAILASISPWNSVFANMMKDVGSGGGGLLDVAQGGLSGAAQGGKFAQLGNEQSIMKILSDRLASQAQEPATQSLPIKEEGVTMLPAKNIDSKKMYASNFLPWSRVVG